MLTTLGCLAAENPPDSNKIYLKFESVSDPTPNFSVVNFTLKNGYSRPVYMSGERTSSRAIRVVRPVADVGCSPASDAYLTEAGREFDFNARKARFIKIPPGEEVKVLTPTMSLKKFKGGSCSISLVLKDGTRVGPIEFQP